MPENHTTVDGAGPGTLSAVAVVYELRPAPENFGPPQTAIDKRPVAGPVELGPLGLAGDTQVDRKFHGGPGKAVYAYADEDAEWWSGELGREIGPGLFGENLRTSGIDVTGAEIGERWAIGSDGSQVLVEVTSARTPCRTFAERMGEKGWVRRYTRVNRPGAYLKVLRPGPVRAGDQVRVAFRPGHGVTVGDFLPGAEPERMRRLVGAFAALGLELDPDVRHIAEKAIRRG
ncbi:MOSC domain-containing protein [Kineosporia sp. J2-2]|uniref:MOSC domain-containing protein n=1 Tax=Kineosporia corallincola TaxID=2835133 RepID=A0ABS5TI95_9ACTN|nr:MOSC domain-containing protein [Kineosporia corallincola]MBT0770824.1 MOSC domain-containing protein [Kineosporia corallincola]